MQARMAKPFVWAMLFLAATICAGWAQAQGGVPSPVVRIGETQKVCQLTGDIDWETGRPTAARTLTNFGLDATDLGYPVDHNGKPVLLFGDSWPPPHGAGPLAEVIPDDAVGRLRESVLATSFGSSPAENTGTVRYRPRR